jgi:NADH-quinone oxidoreductase subunit J
MVITRKNPVASAVFLIATLFLMAATYASLGADFIAAIQILVYAGAIMVLFLFVIMLLNIDPEQLRGPKITVSEIIILAISTLGLIAMATMLLPGVIEPKFQGGLDPSFITENGGNTRVVGLVLFQKYVWPFEIASILILLAIVASVAIAKKDRPSKEVMP